MTIDYRVIIGDNIVSKGVFSMPDDATFEEIDDTVVEVVESTMIVEWKYADEEDKDENWRY